ncbi:MAG: bifunctional adenosylcobinamide kinase/adenosylcobinamide-phosphate guanylyltransferase [Candidatus Omnitrophica bacterium]|nr:bifunctional adenosylcobinamide kinase/adenosylcobinamide-phosphate guanylyltransferase [Candidatus Omnitrophota bacterium]MDD5661712.1 bifunctional adenosylcobinamide kinase/adenosylcobinamide-phosphate guanylyltransferase [Candidatus Omnitrophota bacterium]
MGKITLVLGGVRSGKSAYALSLAGKKKKVAFIATGEGLDKEMRERILKHQKTRPKDWETFEEPRDLTALIARIGDDYDCIIVDCLTLLISNLILAKDKEKAIRGKCAAWLLQLEKKKAKIILVANEVGLGLVPLTKLGRDFRDIAGRINQLAAQEAQEVYLLAAGIPLKIKG